MAKPDSIKSYRQSERNRDVLIGLFALWQRDFPDGIGIGQTIAVKESIVGSTTLSKVGMNNFLELLVELKIGMKK